MSRNALNVLLNLIKYNEVTTVVTVSSDLAFDSEDKIIKAVVQMPNVTHYGGGKEADLPSLSHRRISECLSRGLPVITYAHVSVSELYRRGNPYLLFHTPGESFCSVQFQVASHTLASESKVLLLSHCGTRVEDGQLAMIQITVNRRKDADSTDDTEQTVFDRTYSTDLNHDYPHRQWVQIKDLGLGTYDLKIMLRGSGTHYWQDYVQLEDSKESNDWCQQYLELKPED
jgi:hypothetical protein